jgi:oligoendopeptidase F
MLILATAAFGADDSTWKLEHIYPTVEAWEAARVKASEAITKVGACQGQLDKDAATFLACLDQQNAVEQELYKLHSYASNHSNADTRDDAWQQRDAAVNLLVTAYSEATSWFAPELVKVGAAKVESFITQEPKLKVYDYPLHAVLRHAEHVLSPAEERILALSSAITDRAGGTYRTFANAELPWPTFKLPDGSEVRLQQAAYTKLRSHPDVAVRRAVFDTFFGTLQDFESTMGELMATNVASHWFTAQARGYGSSVESNFVPRAVYDTLITETNANLPTLHRYLKLRADMLGIDRLAYSDLYVPLVSSDRKFLLPETQRITAASAKPLGAAYVTAMQEGFRSGWVDVYPRQGGRGLHVRRGVRRSPVRPAEPQR